MKPRNTSAIASAPYLALWRRLLALLCDRLLRGESSNRVEIDEALCTAKKERKVDLSVPVNKYKGGVRSGATDVPGNGNGS
jgi:hypothetical protein